MTGDLAAWRPRLEGACYDRDHGWHRPVRQPNGRIHRDPIPTDEIRAAGLPERPELGDWIDTLALCTEPLRNLLPRNGPNATPGQ